MAHTPGPWWVCERGSYGPDWEVEDSVGLTCKVYGDDVPAKANARLIAAAPDLYAVCKLLFQCMGEVIEDQNEVAFSDLRMALMKAEGET